MKLNSNKVLKTRLLKFGGRSFKSKRMFGLSVLLAWIVLASIASVDCQLKIVDGGYENLVIEVDESTPLHDCSVINGIKDVLTQGSSALYNATQHRLFIRKVTVIVPSSWTGSSCSWAVDIAPKPALKPAITVGAPHPVYGHAPWTLQVAGCGRPGRMIYMTQQFLSLPNHTAAHSGRIFVKEWAKFRWGVFEETGHLDDPLYPTFYRDRENARTFIPTGCSNKPVRGVPDGLCSSYPSQCSFRADPRENPEVTSSLMYLPHLPKVEYFCNSNTHNRLAPTKHNALCDGRSVQEVVDGHDDLQGVTPGDSHRKTTPIFNFIRPAENRYVIVVEDTNVMNTQKRWELLRKAVRRFLVYHIPPEEKVAVVLFDDKAKTTLHLSVVPKELTKRQVMATASLPRTPSKVSEKSKSILQGMQMAVNILEEGDQSASGSVIFLITSGGVLKDDDKSQLQNLVVDKQVRVVPVIYPVTPRSPTQKGGVQELAHLTGTRWYAVADEGIGQMSKVSMMVGLNRALYSALRIFVPSPVTLPLLIHHKELKGPSGMNSAVSTGDFVLDRTLGGEMRFSVTFFSLGHVGSIALFDPYGINVNEEHKFEDEDQDVNMIYILIKDAKEGRWSYSVENEAHSHQSLHIQVFATPSSSYGSPSSSNSRYGAASSSLAATSSNNAITLETWTSGTVVDTAIANREGPVVVYGKVWSGLQAVIGARVEAIVQRMGINSTGSEYRPITFFLYDNGAGCDITANDGVYCRFLPSLQADRYTVTVVATDAAGRARLIAPDTQKAFYGTSAYDASLYGPSVTYGHDDRMPGCCGSRVPFAIEKPAGMFAREELVGVLNILENIRPFPPARITDLRSIVNPTTNQVTLKWTAPGNQLDHGDASEYEIVFGTDLATVAIGNSTRIMDLKKPEVAGTLTEHVLNRWQHHDTLYFVVIRAVSHVGRPGPWSVPARLFMPSPATITEISTRHSTQAGAIGTVGSGSVGPWEAPRKEVFSTRNLLAIVGAACGFLLIVLILAVYYVVIVTRRRRRKEQKVRKTNDGGASAAAPEQESETDSITKQPAEDMALTEATKEQRPLSPVQSWPASRLLNEHERRQPPEGDCRATNPPPDLGIPTSPNPHPFLYHTMNGRYIEDTIPFDGGSMVSTQPSDSMLVYRLDTGSTETARPGSTLAWDPTHRVITSPVSQPPQFITHEQVQQQQLSSTTLPHDRRRRNVTQV